MQVTSPNACLIIIGNEILSGRTQDTNLAWLARTLNECGIQLRQAYVIPDVEDTIVATVNECRARFTYVFTTGGIGPTHDDITSASIARAFGVPLERHADAQAILEKHYGEKLNAARLKMADIPKGASLIANPVSAAPGFCLGNVYVLAGVPAIMQAMFEGLRHTLSGGMKTLSKTVSAYVTEGVIAQELSAAQNRHRDVEIGSYPFIRQQQLGVSLVCRSTDVDKLNAAYGEVKAILLSKAGNVEEID